jgi:hypothetical protein
MDLMLKALNCPPGEWSAPDVKAWAATPSNADALITWAPSWGHSETQDADWAQSDASVRWAHSTGRLVIVCLPTPSAPPSLGVWESWAQHVLERYDRCLPVLTNEPMNSQAMTADQVVELTKAGCELAVQAGHRRVLIAATDDASQAFEIIPLLKGWQPPRLNGWRWWQRLTIGYAHHHYNDVTYHAGAPVEVRQILWALRCADWCTAGLWLTEGGYRFNTRPLPGAPYPADSAYHAYTQLDADEQAQLSNLPAHYRACQRLGVRLWANYEIRDFMWGGWASGLIRAQNGPPGQGPTGPHPAAGVWPGL